MDQLRDVLARYAADFQAAVVLPLGSAGGMSGALFWRVEPVSGTYMLRRWPREHPSPERLRFIHSVLRHAAARGCDMLPVPVTTRTGETFVELAGYLWELAPLMLGTADYEREPTSEKLRAAMRALATFHRCTSDFPPQPHPRESAPLRHLARLRELRPAKIGELAAVVRDEVWPELAAPARRFLAALPRAIPRAIAQLEPFERVPLPQQPCLRDIWHDHVLFTGDRVTGLVDFGAVDFDTPATDIARLLGSLADAGDDAARTWSAGIAAYISVRPLSNDELRAAYALDASAPILAGCNWIRWIHGEGREFEDHARVLLRFQRILAKALRR